MDRFEPNFRHLDLEKSSNFGTKERLRKQLHASEICLHRSQISWKPVAIVRPSRQFFVTLLDCLSVNQSLEEHFQHFDPLVCHSSLKACLWLWYLCWDLVVQGLADRKNWEIWPSILQREPKGKPVVRNMAMFSLWAICGGTWPWIVPGSPGNSLQKVLFLLWIRPV